MMNFRILRHLVARISIALLLNVSVVWAAGTSTEALDKEAFRRGGTAIATALNARTETIPVAVKAPGEPIPRALTPPPAPQTTEPRMSRWLWTGLLVGFAATGALVYHYATGPGASVRNCSTCN